LFRKLTKRHWTFIILILFVIVLYFILPISIPLIVAFITSLILNPLVRLLQEKAHITRKTSIIIIFCLFILIIGFAGTFIVTKAIAQIVIFVEDIPAHVKQMNTIYEKWADEFQQYTKNLPPEFVNQLTYSIEENLTALNDIVKEKLTINKIAQFFAKVPNFLISFLVYLIALFLFMLELPSLRNKMYNLLKEETAKKVSFMNKRLSDVLLGFLKAQILLSFIIFFTSLIVLLFIAPDVAIIVSLIIWIVDLIPIIGSIIVLGPWSLYMFLAGETVIGIKLTILAIILLSIRRTIEPKVMGQHIGLSPLSTLIAMFLGLKLLGFLGLILGPLFVIAFTSAKEANIIKWDIKI